MFKSIRRQLEDLDLYHIIDTELGSNYWKLLKIGQETHGAANCPEMAIIQFYSHNNLPIINNLFIYYNEIGYGYNGMYPTQYTLQNDLRWYSRDSYIYNKCNIFDKKYDFLKYYPCLKRKLNVR